MLKEQKDLLLQDIDARLPYEVKRKLVIEAIRESIVSGYELDYDIGINNYGYAVFTIWVKNGDSLTVTIDEFLDLKKEALRKIKK